MVSTGAIYTCATFIVLVYSLYVSYLLSYKFNAGPIMYFVIFLSSFVLLRLALSPLINLWSQVPLTPQDEVVVGDPKMDENTCTALFTNPSNGDVMDAMTGYVKEPPTHLSCPVGFVPLPAGLTGNSPPLPSETNLPNGSSFFHYCSPIESSKQPVRPPPAKTKKANQQTTVSKNRFSFYEEY